MTKQYAILQLAIGTVEQGDGDQFPRVSVDLPDSDEELLAYINDLRRQLNEIGAEISEGVPSGGDRENPVPITSISDQSGDLQHVFATRTREAVQMSEVRDDPVEVMEKLQAEHD